MKTMLEIYKAEVQSPADFTYGIKAANKASSETVAPGAPGIVTSRALFVGKPRPSSVDDRKNDRYLADN
jgi:hypothetical protein